MAISFNPVSGAGGTDLADIGADATAGSVIFADGSGFAEDNANLFWDDANNRLGIGTNSPGVALEVTGTIACTTADGPALVDESSSGINPTILPDRSSTGYGVGGTGTEVILVADGERLLAAGNLVVTFYRALVADDANGPTLLDSVSSAINPTVRPDRASSGAGVGGTGGDVDIITNSLSRINVDSTGDITITGNAHTNLAASTENVLLDIDLSATVDFDSGALTTQRAFRVQAPTYSFDGASTITNAATLYIDAAPTAGTNATITNSYALWVDAGNARFDGQVGIQDGSVGSPGIYFLSDVDVGIYRGTSGGVSNFMVFSHGSSSKMSIGSSTIDMFQNVRPDTDNGIDFGSSARSWANVYIHGNIYLDDDDDSYITSDADDAIQIFVGSSEVIEFDATSIDIANTQGLNVTQVVVAGATAIDALTVTSGAHTTLTASTEMPSIHFDLSATQQWATGALTNQRAVTISAPTYAFVGASTITDAATLYIDAAPTAGTNATITNAYALWVDAGASRFDGAILASNGSVGSPAYSFSGDTADGIYWQGGEVHMSIAGVKKFTWRSIDNRGTHFYPLVDDTYSLGTTALAWKNCQLAGDGKLILDDDADTYITSDADDTVQIFSASSEIAEFDTVSIDFKNMRGLSVTAETANSASTEQLALKVVSAGSQNVGDLNFPGVRFDLSASVNFTDITADQTTFVINAATYTSDDGGGDTIASAATLYIDAAPTAGTNVTITNAYALWVDAGTSRFDGQIGISDGDATNPAIFFQSNTDAGIYTTNGNQIHFTLDGTQMVRMDASEITFNSQIIPASGTIDIGKAGGSNWRNLFLQDGSKIYLDDDEDTYITSDADDTVQVFCASTELIEIDTTSIDFKATQSVTIAQVAVTDATPADAFSVTTGAHLSLLNAETIVVDIDLGSNGIQFDGSATITDQRGFRILGATYNFVAAGTITNASSLYIEAAPEAGTNATLTNAYSIFVDAGLARFDGDGTSVWEVPANATDPTGQSVYGRIGVEVTGVGTKYIALYNAP
jgi:hypothetical protein